jgi:hypothetical protein
MKQAQEQKKIIIICPSLNLRWNQCQTAKNEWRLLHVLLWLGLPLSYVTVNSTPINAGYLNARNFKFGIHE